MIPDPTDMAISGRAMGCNGCRSEACRGSQSFVMQAVGTAQPLGAIEQKFKTLAHKLVAMVALGDG